jgi:hypothetical protein
MVSLSNHIELQTTLRQAQGEREQSDLLACEKTEKGNKTTPSRFETGLE